MRRSIAALGVSLVVAAAVVVAAPAAADSEQDYLGPLLIKYSFLSGQQLLTESTRVCAVVHTGKSASDAVPLVQKDLGVTVAAALDIIEAAVPFRHC